jgi:hypothetical protein
MFGVHGELAFLAESCGATRVVLFDGMDPTEEFARRHAATSSAVDFFQGDLHDPAVVDELGSFDVVWCSGVVYHSPHPLLQLQAIRRMTHGTAVVGSLVLPELPGIEQACVLYPGCSPAAQAVFAGAFGGPGRFPGMSAPFDESPLMAYANMWWGITPSALRSMLRYSGFDVVEEHQLSPFSIDVVARVGGVDPGIFPPHGQSHERLRQRMASGDAPSYAQAQWSRLSPRRS